MILHQLKNLRTGAALSQRDLAQLADVSPATVFKAENGAHVYPSTVRKLAAALHVKPSALLAPASGAEQ